MNLYLLFNVHLLTIVTLIHLFLPFMQALNCYCKILWQLSHDRIFVLVGTVKENFFFSGETVLDFLLFVCTKLLAHDQLLVYNLQKKVIVAHAHPPKVFSIVVFVIIYYICVIWSNSFLVWYLCLARDSSDAAENVM